MRPVLIVRPEPGAAQTAVRGRALGLNPVVAPIFELRGIPWEAPPAAEFQAVLLTSANAARLGGTGMEAFRHLPCYAVGEATTQAAWEAGFTKVRTGPSDGAALLQLLAEDGICHAFHPRGRDHVQLQHRDIRIESRAVYVSEGGEVLTGAAVRAMADGALVLLHSPRAASHFARLVEATALPKADIDLAFISRSAAIAAGADWRSASVAAAPRDDALLELAAKLCKD